MIRFTDLNPESYRGAVVIVDIDETLVWESGHAIDVSLRQQLAEFSKYAAVFLCSGTRSTARHFELARETGTTYIGSILRASGSNVMQLIPESAGRRLVVLGGRGKLIERFAEDIGAEFVRLAPVYVLAGKATVQPAKDTPRLTGGAEKRTFTIRDLVQLRLWTPNVAVFLPIVFTGKFFHAETLAASCAAFALLCLSEICLTSIQRTYFQTYSESLDTFKTALFGGMQLALVVVLITLLPSLGPAAFVYFILRAYSVFRLKGGRFERLFAAYLYAFRTISGGVAAGVFVSPLLLLAVFFWAYALLGREASSA